MWTAPGMRHLAHSFGSRISSSTAPSSARARTASATSTSGVSPASPTNVFTISAAFQLGLIRDRQAGLLPGLHAAIDIDQPRVVSRLEEAGGKAGAVATAANHGDIAALRQLRLGALRDL